MELPSPVVSAAGNVMSSPIKTVMPGTAGGTPTIIRVSSPMTSMGQTLVRPGTNVVRVRAPGKFSEAVIEPSASLTTGLHYANTATSF